MTSEVPKKTRSVKKSRNWSQEEIFQNSADAQNFIDLERCWSTRYTNKSDHGKKVFYRCNLTKKRDPQCEASLQLFYDSASFRVFLLRSGNHTHNEICSETRTKSVKIPPKLSREKFFENSVDDDKSFIDLEESEGCSGSNADIKVEVSEYESSDESSEAQTEDTRFAQININDLEGFSGNHIEDDVPQYPPSIAETKLEGSSKSNRIEESISSDEFSKPRAETTRAPKKNLNWTQENIFDNSVDAQSFIDLEGCWATRYTNETEHGRKVFYRCNLVKKRGPQCEASLQLHYDSASFKVFLLRSGNHTHKTAGANRCGMDHATKKIIEEMFNNNIKRKEIFSRLTSTSSVTMVQVKNYLQKLGKIKYGGPTVSLLELEAFLLANIALQDDPTKAFVVEYEFCDTDKTEFRFFISSRKMLKLASKSKIIHADATYKLYWNGFSVLFVGTTDMDQQFHHFGLVVCTNETSQDFEFIFRSLKSGVEKIGATEIMPEVLIADSSSSIHNGFRNIFGSENTILMCFVHMRKSVSKNVEKLIPIEDRVEILSNLDHLQLTKSPEVFERVARLFIQKWSKYKQFTTYFQDAWLEQNRNWYEGACLKAPSTNNALEAAIKIIKDENIIRNRLPLNEFTELILEMVSKWSLQYPIYNERRTVTLSDWNFAYQWATKNKPIKRTSTETHDLFFVVAGDETEQVEPSPVDSWKDFAEFLENYFKIWTLRFPKHQETSWVNGSCDCPKFMKCFMCEHVVGVPLRFQYTTEPTEEKNQVIGQKRKRCDM